MKVISGKYKGRTLKGYDIVGTRPTMDRVKESLFAMITPYLLDATCLDLFAGSGALGIEALSNGTKYCYFVDNNPKAIKVLKENLTKLDIINAQVILADARKVLSKLDVKFDLIFLDPPYQADLLNLIIAEIERLKLLKPEGKIICEYEKLELKTNLKLLKTRSYGSKNISIYENL